MRLCGRKWTVVLLAWWGAAACQQEAASALDAAAMSSPDAQAMVTPDVGALEADAGEATPDAAQATPDAGDATPDAGGPKVSCDGLSLRPVSADTSTAGPWQVGVRTATVADLTVEVWYPAASVPANAPQVRYDIREALPGMEGDKIPDADNPWQPCDCYRDVPIDDAHGPYPVIVFVHGTAAFRTQSVQQMVHWASRGFVVLAADHPGLRMADTLGLLCGIPGGTRDLQGNLQAMLAAVESPAGDLAFLASRVDKDKIGMAGHSAGGSAIAGLGDRAQVLIPMAAGGVTGGSALVSTLVMGATEDTVVRYDRQVSGYSSSPSPQKRLVGIADTGHLAFSGLCSLSNATGEDLLDIASRYGVCGAAAASFLFDCQPTYLDDPISWQIINDATAAVLEETLHCSETAAARFDDFEARYPEVREVRQSP